MKSKQSPDHPKPTKKMKNSHSTIAVRKNDENSSIKEEENKRFRNGKKLGDRSNLSHKDIHSAAGGENKSGSEKKHKSFLSGSNYAEKLKARRSPKGKDLDRKTEKSEKLEKPDRAEKTDPHLSAYADEISAHSSAMSNSSRPTKKTDPPPIPKIPQIKEANPFEIEDQVLVTEPDAKDEKIIEYDDFTEKQKKYIDKLLNDKLSTQKEKMIEYFQSVQLEMVRQFQLQYLELSDVLENAVEEKQKRDFYDKYT